MRTVAVLCFLALFGAPSLRAEARIEQVTTTLEGRRVLVSFRLVDSFDQALRDRIQSGLPTGISYELQFLKDRPRWWDRQLAESTLQIVAMFNAVTRDYLVNMKLDGRLIESRQVRDLDELERALTVIDRLPAFQLGEVQPDWRMLVAVRAELGSRTLLLFIPTRHTTDWVESKKFRPPAEGN